MKIRDIVTFVSKSIVPKQGTTYHLYSLPSFDDGQKYEILASKDGFKTQSSIIDWHVSGWYYAGNLVIGGLIGYLIVDPLTGDMYYLDEEVHLNMQPSN